LSNQQEKKKNQEICVFVEQSGGNLEQVSLEVLGKAREIADMFGASVTALLLGDKLSDLTEQVARSGADLVIAAQSPLLGDFTSEVYAKVVEAEIRKRDPNILLLGATHGGANLAAILAVRLGAGLMAHVVDLEVEQSTNMLLGSVPGFGGSIVSVCKCSKGRLQMASVRPGVFKALEPSDKIGRIMQIQPEISTSDKKTVVLERSVKRSKELSRAERVVIAGLGSKGNLELPRKIAEKLNAELGVSRPLADKGMAGKELVVGSTGSGLNAKLALVLGVSGAAHFASGLRDVKTVIAIDTDPKSQIFKQADYCVNADMFEVLPLLITELEKS
jgi:electron transfer flavoprotein alpha subunit